MTETSARGRGSTTEAMQVVNAPRLIPARTIGSPANFSIQFIIARRSWTPCMKDSAVPGILEFNESCPPQVPRGAREGRDLLRRGGVGRERVIGVDPAEPEILHRRMVHVPEDGCEPAEQEQALAAQLRPPVID